MPSFYPLGTVPIGSLDQVLYLEATFTCAASIAGRGVVHRAGYKLGRPASSNDDGYMQYNNTTPNSITFDGALKLGLTTVSDIYHTFIRFPSVTIPEGAVIDRAHLILTSSSSVNATTPLTLVAEDVKFSLQLTTVGDWSVRPTTTANVTWTSTLTTPGMQVISSDISPVIQELVDRTDWLDPNDHAIQLFIQTSDLSTLGVKSFYSYDQSAALCPKLLVTYDGKVLVGQFEAGSTFASAGYTVPKQVFNATATLSASPTMNYLVTQDILGEASFDYGNAPQECAVAAQGNATFECDPFVRRTIVVPPPTIYGDDGGVGGTPINTPASSSVGGMSLAIARNISTSGGAEDFRWLHTAQVQTGTPAAFGDPIFSIGELRVSYDEGKTLQVTELGVQGYGQPTYNLEDRVWIAMNLGYGSETYFRGRIKRINHKGDNNNESVEYDCVGIPNLANEVELVGPYGDGYYLSDFTLPSTIQIEPGNVIAGTMQEPRLLINAVQGLFNGFANTLTSYGISANVDLSGLSQQACVEGETQLSGGFFDALKSLIKRDPGVKVWFDDTDETWKFVRTMDAPVLDIQVQDSYLESHNWSEDSSDRYTAVNLIASGENITLSIPTSTSQIAKGWTSAAEQAWHIQKNTKTGFPAHTQGSDDELSEEEKVWREWILLQPLGTVKQGRKCKISYKLKNEQWAQVEAEMIPPTPGAVSLQTGQTSTAQPYARVRATVPLTIDGNPKYAGGAIGPSLESMFVTYYVPIPLPDTFVIRYPATGYAGDAYTRYGIRREKVINVEPAELSYDTARRLHRLHSDIRMTCSLPIYGDPMRDMLRFLQGRITLTDIYGVTGLENSRALITGYSYNFQENVGTIDISSDLTNFIGSIGEK